jgi:UDPglucose 6-dehydrogenase
MAGVCIIGVGYVGLVTAACLADLGNDVVGLDADPGRVECLRQGQIPIYEPGLEELVSRNVLAGRLTFTTDYSDALVSADFAFIAVGTPTGVDGEADMHHVRAAAEGIARAMRRPLVIVNKSTVPVGSGDWVEAIVKSAQGQRVGGRIPFDVVSNPEFLREGSAIHDFQNPDRIVLGSSNPEAVERVASLYQPLRAPILTTDLRTAEMIKYASNSFLATKISFINEMATICERLGADVKMVSKGMGLDKRIGSAFLEAGLGWGGSCFPKDIRALEYMAAMSGCHPQLLRSVIEINRHQRQALVLKVREVLGGSLLERRVAVLGLSFKPNTDDLRDSPAIAVAQQLAREGAEVRAYDPVAMEGARAALPEATFCADAYDAARGADALVVCTDWNEFKQLDLERLRLLLSRPIVVDGRNIYPPERMAALGFVYRCLGRPELAGADFEEGERETERTPVREAA